MNWLQLSCLAIYLVTAGGKTKSCKGQYIGPGYGSGFSV